MSSITPLSVAADNPYREEAQPSALARFVTAINQGLGWFSPIADLLVRFWVGWVFLKSGLTKTQTSSFNLFGSEFSYPTSLNPTSTTITLFKYEYKVPLLSPEWAAQLGTMAELLLPVFLILGLAGRYAALALFIFNITAVISYPGLNPIGLEQHQVWGILLLVTICHGPGKLSVDHLMLRFYGR